MAESLAVFRDIAIIVLALINIALIAMLLAIAIIMWRMLSMLSREAPEFLDKAKEMTVTAQGTVDFVGSTIARPAIRLTALLAGFQRFLEIIALGNRQQEARQRSDGVTEVRQ